MTTRGQIRLMFGCALVLAICLSSRPIQADAITEAGTQIVEADLSGHLNVLASDTLEGRGAGSPGGKAAGTYIAEQLQNMGVTPAGEDGTYFQSFGKEYRNLLAIVPGSDEKFKEEIIVVCGHYDHVGFGRNKNSLGSVGKIHNGADDNGSGVSGMLEILQSVMSTRSEFKRTLLFVFWDAEELGLLGSKHWVETPTIPLERIRLVINIDMIGRLRDQSVEMYGTRTAIGLRQMICQHNVGNQLLIDENWDIIRNSDHYPFAKKNIPFLLFHTRKHDDYHRPSDDIDKINLAGMQTISRLVFRTVHSLANQSQLSSFREQAWKEDEETRKTRLKSSRSKQVRLGVSWDPEFAKRGEIRVTKVHANSAAQKAGLLIGDQIVRIGKTRSEADVSFLLAVMSAPKKTEIEVIRGNQQLSLPVTLNGEPRRMGITWDVDGAEPSVILITGVFKNSPASVAKLRAGDRITKVAGKVWSSVPEFIQIVDETEGKLSIEIERRGQFFVKQVQLLPKQ